MNSENSNVKSQKIQMISWILIIIAMVFLITIVVIGKTEMGLLIIPLISIFAIVHGLYRYGGKNLLNFFLIASIVSWGYESLSIVTGFPFGNYYYSDILGPKLGLVPIIIPVSYFCIAYLAWTVGQVLIDQQNSFLRKSSVLTKAQMLTPCVMYGVLSLQYSLNIFAPGNEQITSLDGLVWETASINEGLTVVCLFTMVFVTVLSVIKVLTGREHV